MKKFLSLVLSVMLFSMGSIVSFANTKVTATNDTIHTLYLNSVQTKLPDGIALLNYNNRLYVPLRFISDNVYLKLDYDAGSRQVFISESPEVTMYKNRVKEQEKAIADLKAENEKLKKDLEDKKWKEDMKKETGTFKNLPVGHRDSKYDFNVDVTDVTRKVDAYGTTQFYLKIRNKSVYDVHIDLNSMRFEDEKGNEYNIRVERPEFMTSDLYGSLPQDFDKEVYISVNLIDKAINKGYFVFDYEWLVTGEKVSVKLPIILKDFQEE